MTPAHLMLIDMLVEQVISIGGRIAKVKDMKEEELNEALKVENERSNQLKDLLEADLK